MTRSFALFTKTYVGDHECFAQLCQSIDRHMPEITHYVLVDHSDVALFERYHSDKRKIIDCKTILPQFRELNLPGRRIWWKFPAVLVRGWIYQQLIKIGFSATISESAVVLVDSDVTFRRALTADDVFAGDRVKFYRAPDRADGPQFEQWHRIAQRSLGVAETGYSGYDYIIPAIPISPAVMRAMIARVQDVAGRDWAYTLARHFRFSEYVLYGNFCDKVAGPHQELVKATPDGFCHCSWDYDLDNSVSLDEFVKAFGEQHACVVVQSNLGLSEQKRAEVLSAFDAQTEQALGG